MTPSPGEHDRTSFWSLAILSANLEETEYVHSIRVALNYPLMFLGSYTYLWMEIGVSGWREK